MLLGAVIFENLNSGIHLQGYRLIHLRNDYYSNTIETQHFHINSQFVSVLAKMLCVFRIEKYCSHIAFLSDDIIKKHKAKNQRTPRLRFPPRSGNYSRLSDVAFVFSDHRRSFDRTFESRYKERLKIILSSYTISLDMRIFCYNTGVK